MATSGVYGARTSASAAKKRPKKKKPATIVVARGHMEVPAGASRPLTLKLTKPGIALLVKRRELRITVTVTTTGRGRPKTVERHQVRVRYVKPVKRRPKR